MHLFLCRANVKLESSPYASVFSRVLLLSAGVSTMARSRQVWTLAVEEALSAKHFSEWWYLKRNWISASSAAWSTGALLLEDIPQMLAALRRT